MEENIKLDIFELPPEILLNIFRYIDVRTLYGIVILTCKHFHEILTGDGIWKALFGLKWEEHQVIDDMEFVNSWSHLCITFEDVENFWKSSSYNDIIKTTHLAGHHGIVDACHIMPSREIVVTGSRDRQVLVWKIKDFLEGNSTTELTPPDVLKEHKGWVWQITSDPLKDNEIITTSWDNTVKIWDLQNIGTCANTLDYHPAPVLAICCQNGIYTTGCYDKKLRRFDVRSGKIIFDGAFHKDSVLTLQMTDNFIFSGSQDKTIGIFDIRANKLFTTLRLDSPVLCMNLAQEQGLNYLRAGGRDGNLYTFNISPENRFNLLNSYQLWADGHKVSKLCNFKGCLIACSEGGSIRAYTPDRQCTFVRKLHDAHYGGVTSCHSNKNLFVTGGSDAGVVAWKWIRYK